MQWPHWLSRWWPGTGRPASLGDRGEAQAARFLRRKGYKLLGRHDRRRAGELDLVALDGQVIVFVEVKTRRSAEFGHPAEAVGPEKQRRLTRAALAWLKRYDLLDQPARFDVIAITWPLDAKHPTIEHFPNAFEACGLRGFHS